jgi:2-polyprenyl-3-methyl-5-hydroxy-6-metoxy-1,4-benzoquinol methylase
MRIGDLSIVEVDDVRIAVKWSYGQMKDFARKLQDLPESTEAFDALLEADVLPHVRRVEGLVNEAGEAVTELTLAVLNELPPAIVGKFLQGLQGVKLENPPA